MMDYSLEIRDTCSAWGTWLRERYGSTLGPAVIRKLTLAGDELISKDFEYWNKQPFVLLYGRALELAEERFL